MQDIWTTQYSSKDYINPQWYNKIMYLLIYNEQTNIIKELANDKATSPLGISNKMLKHLGTKTNKALWILIYACIKINRIPKEWKQANVYPISKPQDWKCSLDNTQPITLLKTPRKALVKLLNRCLTSILAKHNILKGYNFAGLSGKSTMKPICIMNNILKDVKANNKELWILFQDMSKAYDRVNITNIKVCNKTSLYPAMFHQPDPRSFFRKNKLGIHRCRPNRPI